MRIGIVAPYDLSLPGGVQAQVLGLEEELTKRGHTVEVVAPGRRELGRVRRIKGNASVAPIVLDPRGGRRARKALEGCDVVHIHEPLMPAISFGALRTGIPTVVTFHADAPRWAHALYRAAGPVIRRRLAGTLPTAVSEIAASAPKVLGLDPSIIPNGVTVPDAVPESRAGVVFVGRDDKRKGLPVLLSAMREVRRAVPDVSLTLIGVEAEFEGAVSVGRVSDEERDRLLQGASVFVAPNTSGESFGIVVAEGMAAGCAVVASDLPAFTAVGGDAVAFAPVGHSELLAQRIISLLTDDGHRRTLAAAGRERVRRFSWEAVTEQYLDAYHRAQ